MLCRQSCRVTCLLKCVSGYETETRKEFARHFVTSSRTQGEVLVLFKLTFNHTDILLLLGRECAKYGVTVYIDAEYSQLQPGVRLLALALMNIFNKERRYSF
jgi:hypothetical protein